MIETVAMILMAVASVVVTTLTLGGSAKSAMSTGDLVAHVESQCDYMKAQLDRVSSELNNGTGVSIHDVAPTTLGIERADYELLLDELQPAEGTATHWALNWHIEDVNRRMGKSSAESPGWNVPRIAPLSAERTGA